MIACGGWDDLGLMQSLILEFLEGEGKWVAIQKSGIASFRLAFQASL